MMLKTGGVIRLFIILAIFIAILGSAFEVSHNPNQFSFYTDRGFHRVRAPDFYPSGNPGAPELPVKYLHYIIPPNMEAEGIRIISSSTAQISGSYYIFPAQRPVPLCSIPPWTPPDSIIYNSDSLYPNNPIEIVRNGVFDGARLVTIAVYPLQYRPRSRRLFLVRNVSFDFQFRPTNLPDRARVRGINSQKIYDAILSTAVENDGEISLYYQQPNLIPEEPPSKLQPTTYTIITNDAIPGMMEEFQYFADWLTEKGIPAVVYPLSLALRYPGIDDAERLRNFIIDAYKQCGTIWVLLGGDAGVVPYRKGCAYINDPYDGRTPPSDLYFSDMNGNWDVDGDRLWGEPTEEQGDSVDIYPEVFVGRILTRNPEETGNWVDKVLHYEQYGSDQLELFRQTDWIYDSVHADLYPYQMTREQFPPYYIHYNHNSKPANEVGWGLNCGYGLYQIYCHGGPGRISTIPGYYVCAYYAEEPTPYRFGLNHLTNEGRYYIVYSIGCYNAAYDLFIPFDPEQPPTDTTFADGFTDTYARKGAVAFLGNTRFGFRWLSRDLHYAFCKLFFGSTEQDIFYITYPLGVIEGWSKVNFYYPGHPWYLIHAHNLFGSPESDAWINKPGMMSVAHPEWIPAQQEVEFPVKVKDEVGPLDYVRVCLHKRDDSQTDIYQVGYTGKSGIVVFKVFASTPGVLKVTCTRPREQTRIYAQYLPTQTICQVGTRDRGGQAEKSGVPKEFSLTLVSPVLSSRILKLFYGLPENGKVRLTLYDRLGREAMVLKDEKKEPGYYAESYNLSTKRLSSGVYWLELKTEGKRRSKKLVLIQ